MSESPTDEQVLADPGSFTIEQVTAVFSRSSEADVDAAKALEAAEQNRKGIREWERPQPAAADVEPTFPLERLLGPDGPRITGYPVYVLAGALHGQQSDVELTRSDVAKLVDQFGQHEVEEVQA